MSNKAVHALVTGASRGIGKHITQLLLDDDAQILGTTRKTSFPEQFVSNPNFEALQVDLSDPVSVESILKPIFSRTEAPNVLINNAGIFEEAGMNEDDES